MTIFKLAAALVLAGTAVGAESSTTDTGSIGNLVPIANGPVLFNHSGNRSTPPACATVAGRWAIDASTPGGQAKLAVLLTAYAQHKQIVVIGTGTCDVWPDTETVNYINTND